MVVNVDCFTVLGGQQSARQLLDTPLITYQAIYAVNDALLRLYAVRSSQSTILALKPAPSAFEYGEQEARCSPQVTQL